MSERRFLDGWEIKAKAHMVKMAGYVMWTLGKEGGMHVGSAVT